MSAGGAGRSRRRLRAADAAATAGGAAHAPAPPGGPQARGGALHFFAPARSHRGTMLLFVWESKGCQWNMITKRL